MNAAHAVLALALFGADGMPTEAAPQIVYEFRVVEMTGVTWRERVYPTLQRVTRQEGATVWTTTGATAGTIVKQAERVVAAPKLTAFSEAVAHVTTKVARPIVTDVKREADWTVDHVTKASYSPQTERIREGTTTTIAGRKLDQGVLVRLVVEDTHVAAVHPVHVGAGDLQPSAKVEVPEVVHQQLAGEWLIPNDGVLLASLGVYSTADAKGKSVTHERLLLVKAASLPEPVAIGLVPVPPVRAGAGTHVAMPAPCPPSRTLPQGLNADGEPVPLPPLPPEAPAPTSRPDSAEPVATPQVKQHSPGTPLPEPKPEAPAPERQASPKEPDVKRTSLGDAAMPKRPAPEPLPESAVPPRPTHDELAREREFRRSVDGIIDAVDHARMLAEAWNAFWATTQAPPPQPERGTGAAASPGKGPSYDFRWPLNGLELEVRITAKRAADAASRPAWRPSGDSK